MPPCPRVARTVMNRRILLGAIFGSNQLDHCSGSCSFSFGAVQPSNSGVRALVRMMSGPRRPDRAVDSEILRQCHLAATPFGTYIKTRLKRRRSERVKVVAYHHRPVLWTVGWFCNPREEAEEMPAKSSPQGCYETLSKMESTASRRASLLVEEMRASCTLEKLGQLRLGLP